MIDFNEKGSWAGTCRPDEVEELRADHNKRIKSDLSNIANNKFSLGAHLLDLYRSNSYAKNIQHKQKWAYVEDKGYFDWVDQDGYWGDVRPCRFFEYCEEHFGIDKTQVSRYMNIVDEFGDQYIGFKKEWQPYSYSQLVELLSLTPEQRKEVKPDWTIKRIREYKRELNAPSRDFDELNKFLHDSVATSQQTEPLVQSVATSQQEDESMKLFDRKAYEAYAKFSIDMITIPLSDDKYDYTLYDRFRGYTLQTILDRLIGAESELEMYREKDRAVISQENADNFLTTQ